MQTSALILPSNAILNAMALESHLTRLMFSPAASTFSGVRSPPLTSARSASDNSSFFSFSGADTESSAALLAFCVLSAFFTSALAFHKQLFKASV
jgi:hypothetical protein